MEFFLQPQRNSGYVFQLAAMRLLVCVVFLLLWGAVHSDPKVVPESTVFLGSHDMNLGGGFKHFLFSPLLGEMIQFD